MNEPATAVSQLPPQRLVRDKPREAAGERGRVAGPHQYAPRANRVTVPAAVPAAGGPRRSTTPPTSVATAGRPFAIPSITVKGVPSLREVIATASRAG